MMEYNACEALHHFTQRALAQEGGGCAFAIHPLWLRERCQDVGSIDQTTRQPLYDPSDLHLDPALAAGSEAPPGHCQLRFSDGHEAESGAREILAEAALEPGDSDCRARSGASIPAMPSYSNGSHSSGAWAS